MKKNGFEIGIIICIILFSLILFGGYLLYDLYLSSKSYTMFLSPYTVLDCKKWECKNVSDKLSLYNNKAYNIFVDGKNIGVYDLYYSTGEKRFYVFNKNNDSLYKEGVLFAYSGMLSVSQIDYQVSSINSQELSDLRKNVSENFGVEDVDKVTMDFDDDGSDENLYVINKEILEVSKFSALIYEDGGKYTILEESISEDITESGTGYVSNVLDVSEDGKLEFIYTLEYFDDIGRCNVMYRLKGKKYVKVNECEVNNY